MAWKRDSILTLVSAIAGGICGIAAVMGGVWCAIKYGLCCGRLRRFAFKKKAEADLELGNQPRHVEPGPPARLNNGEWPLSTPANQAVPNFSHPRRRNPS